MVVVEDDDMYLLFHCNLNHYDDYDYYCYCYYQVLDEDFRYDIVVVVDDDLYLEIDFKKICFFLKIN